MKRDRIKKFLSYSTLQSIVENTIGNIPDLNKADMSKIKPYIFNGLVKRANNVKNTVR